MTLAKSDLAQQEVLLELGPLFARRRPKLAARASGPAAFDEMLMLCDEREREAKKAAVVQSLTDTEVRQIPAPAHDDQGPR